MIISKAIEIHQAKNSCLPDFNPTITKDFGTSKKQRQWKQSGLPRYKKLPDLNPFSNEKHQTMERNPCEITPRKWC